MKASQSLPTTKLQSAGLTKTVGHHSTGSLQTHQFLKSKFKPGSAKFDKSNFTLEQKIFHIGDVPLDVRQARQVVDRSKRPNILGVEQKTWNQSTIANPKVQRDTPELKTQLLQIRAGLLDEKTLSTCKMHSDEEIAERQRFIVAMQNKGPIGLCSGKWMCAVDERGLPAHCIRDDWPDWNASMSTHTKDDAKQAVGRFDEREARRMRGYTNGVPSLNKDAYVSPQRSQDHLNCRLREIKVDFQELKEEFKKALKYEFPEASEERLQAMAQRLLGEKLLADEKAARFPYNNESFKPTIALTAQDRRYKVYRHAGAWTWNAAEKRFCWSCCMNFQEDSRGCEYGVVNPDAWCVQGYERQPGITLQGKA
eukprot:TRINITY_DN10627_c0_g1_i2.p1 TRINITY_DN10627_c0_g1~~TRINITY_DN10627_c0_g1_i2.p1  ORF type:complete len:367 (+),score=107.46 TRINITY_DN10627_c0_g1_i2:109-1209(+)